MHQARGHAGREIVTIEGRVHLGDLREPQASGAAHRPDKRFDHGKRDSVRCRRGNARRLFARQHVEVDGEMDDVRRRQQPAAEDLDPPLRVPRHLAVGGIDRAPLVRPVEERLRVNGGRIPGQCGGAKAGQ